MPAILERINRGSSTADSVTFRIVFTEDVIFSEDPNLTSIDPADFSVTGSTATVTNVILANRSTGEVRFFDIVVSGGDLTTVLATEGAAVGLELSASQNIISADSTPVPTAAPTGNNQTFPDGNATPGRPIDPPTDPNEPVDPTNPGDPFLERVNTPGVGLDPEASANSLTFRAIFNEAVQNVDTNDFSVVYSNGNVPLTANVTKVQLVNESVASYDITVDGGNLAAFSGTVGIALAGAQDIVDNDGNSVATAPPTGANRTYDVTNGGDISDTLFLDKVNLLSDENTSEDTLSFRVVFNEAAQSVSVEDWVVTGGSTATVTEVFTVNDGENRLYDVTVSGGNLAEFNGTVGLALSDSQDITDASGDSLPTTEPATTNRTYNVTNGDGTSDTLVLDKVTLLGDKVTSEDVLGFSVVFNEAAQNVSVEDWVVTGDSTATVTEVVAVNDGTNTTYNLTVSGGDLAGFNGPLGIALSGSQDIADADGDGLPIAAPETTNQTYNVTNIIDPPPQGSLTPAGDILEVALVNEAVEFSLTEFSGDNVGQVKIFQTDATGSKRSLIAGFSVLEDGVLPASFAPSFTLTGDDFAANFDDGSADSDFIQVEIVEKGLVSLGDFKDGSPSKKVSADFAEGDQLAIALTDSADVDNLIFGNGKSIDLTGLTGTSEVTFTVYREAALDNLVGFYTTDTADGGIVVNDITGETLIPGDEGYEEAAMANKLNVELTGENGRATTFDASIDNGVFLGTYIKTDGVDGDTWFSHQAANSDGVNHVRQVGSNAIGIEDIAGGGDFDYNDMVVEIDVKAIAVF